MGAVNLPDIDAEIATLTLPQQAWLMLLLASDSGPSSTHLYRPEDSASSVRLINLVRYLRTVSGQGSEVALVGEAPGHIGTRRTGIPFMSEPIVRGEQPLAEAFVATASFLPSVEDDPPRREVSSTAVWATLESLSPMPYLWAAYPHHPFRGQDVRTNRTPTPTEVREAATVLKHFLEAFSIKQVIAVGAVAERTLLSLGVSCQRVRHPARGGAAEFRVGVRELLDTRDNYRTR